MVSDYCIADNGNSPTTKMKKKTKIVLEIRFGFLFTLFSKFDNRVLSIHYYVMAEKGKSKTEE